MLGKPAQASMEYVMIAGFVALVIIPTTFLFYSYASDSAEEIDRAQIDKFGRDVVSTAETVYYLGEPSRIIVSERLPKNVNNVSILYDATSGTYLFSISALSDGSAYAYTFPTKVNLFGVFGSEDFNSGIKNVRLEAKKDASGNPFVAITFDRPLLRVFVTSALYFGDLNGFTNGDVICQQRANSASLGGTWRAWLSNNTVNAKDRITDGVYIRMDNKPVATSLGNLTNGRLLNPLMLNELGESTSGQPQDVWTGTSSDGTLENLETCGDWDVSSASGRTGLSFMVTGAWTAATHRPCTLTARLYCFEQ